MEDAIIWPVKGADISGAGYVEESTTEVTMTGGTQLAAKGHNSIIGVHAAYS
jgi:hypothetical protein